MKRDSVDAVVVSAGAGRRMGGVAKGLALVAGRPALAWSLEALAADSRVQRIALVVPPEQLVDYASLDWLPDRVVTIVAGGATRAASVAAGIAALVDAPGSAAAMVLIHDAARPLLDAATLDRVIVATAEFGAAIPAIPIADTVKRVVESGGSEGAGKRSSAESGLKESLRWSGGSVDRSSLVAAQTPQGIAARHLAAFVDAVRDAGNDATDDAALLEGIGVKVRIVDGDVRLRKLTLPSDLLTIEAMVSAPSPLARQPGAAAAASLEARIAAAGESLGGGGLRGANLRGANLRIGWGDDAHPVGTAGSLLLGGVSLPESPALIGHSDGDVVLHAVADALLGAARLGDLGRIFPADDRTPKGIASGELLAEVRRRVAEVGVTPLWVDMTITAKSPRLSEHLESIAASIASLLGMSNEAVSVKASTGNLIGDEGAGRAIRCQVLLLAEQVPG